MKKIISRIIVVSAMLAFYPGCEKCFAETDLTAETTTAVSGTEAAAEITAEITSETYCEAVSETTSITDNITKTTSGPSADTFIETAAETTSAEPEEEILPGDITGDGVINAADLLELTRTLLQQNMNFSDDTKKAYDLNDDKKIDILDLAYLKIYISENSSDLFDLITITAKSDYANSVINEFRMISPEEAEIRRAAKAGNPFPVEVYNTSRLNMRSDHNADSNVMGTKYLNNSNKYATVFETWEDPNTHEMWGKITLDRIEAPKWICLINASENNELTLYVRIPKRNTVYTLPDPDSYEYKLLVDAVYHEANGVNSGYDETSQLRCKGAIVAEILDRCESGVMPGSTIEQVLDKAFSGSSNYLGSRAYSYYDDKKNRYPGTLQAVENAVRYFFEHQEDFGFYLYNRGLWAERHINENYFSYDYNYYFDLTDPYNRDKFLRYN